nr:HEAT repeat domain-containing protein [Chloroflexota bacterium]
TGKRGEDAAVAALASISGAAEPLVRGHAAWALGKIATGEAANHLEQSLVSETDEYVRGEIEAALNESAQTKTSRAGS